MSEQLVTLPWLTVEFLEPIVEKHVEHYRRIIDFKPTLATQPGVNFSSVIVRAHLTIELTDGSTKEVFYILKASLDVGSPGGDFTKNMNLFPKEKLMFEQNIAAFHRLYEEKILKVQLSPHCYHIASTPERYVFVLEDLKSENYRLADRFQGLDMQHMTCILRKIAELHAASAVYYEINGSYGPLFAESLYTDESKPMFDALSKATQKFRAPAMRKWNLENVEKYIKIMPGTDEIFNIAKSLYNYDPKEFNVLNHGDCWLTNMMFRYDENDQLIDGRLIDFQISKWGSPVQDLWFVIVTSAAPDIKVLQYDHFIKIYHDRLHECLQALDYPKPIPSLRDLHILMLKYGYWGMYTAIGVLQTVMFPPGDNMNMDNLLRPGPEGDALREALLNNPKYAKAMCQLLPFLERKGLLQHTC